ncbi:MAG TPA: S8 family serine peptidase [Geminicoccaceae bacterium]|nr:S8 family serine peptidase [Geminicoccus sp.]HMU50469.1 S8 family serine peptidase [Geminicoccaceae bacterium]
MATPKRAPRRRTRTEPPAAADRPGDILRIAVTFPRPGGQDGVVRSPARLGVATVMDYQPEESDRERALEHLERLGFRVTQRGRLSVSVRGTRELFERTFGTRLARIRLPEEPNAIPQARSVLYPPEGAPWSPEPALESLVDDAYIQWPHLYFNNRFAPPPSPSPIPPRVGYHHLRVPGDVTLLLGVDRVHRAGTTGKGVRVAMIDSGFAHGHAYFAERGYNTATVLAPGANQPDLDGNGHGTGESANLLAIAPDVTFFGIKLDNESNAELGASVLEGFQTALRHDPRVISVSLGYDLCDRRTNQHLTSLPNGLKALEAEIQAAVASGVTVVFSAGNGHVSFPGMMREVVSAGGVFVAEDGRMLASDYASAFDSRIYPGRHVPDFCGLVGEQANGAAYIMLPVPRGSELDRLADDTAGDDGWGVFSGTSAAAPQLAGVCALLLEKNPGLSPADLRNVVAAASRDVVLGAANPASNANAGGMPADVGADGATGAGLVDAFAAWRLI